MDAKQTAEGSPTDTSFFPDEDEGDESSRALLNDGEPDVLLEAPEVNVERISIETEHLRTGVSLFARVGNFVALEVGANAQLDNVSLKMRGVRTQGRVKIHLQKVYALILRTLASIDRKPELVSGPDRPMPQLGTSIGTEVGLPEQTGEKAASPVADKADTAAEKMKGAPTEKKAGIEGAVGAPTEKTAGIKRAVGAATEKMSGIKEAVGTATEKTAGIKGAVGAASEKAGKLKKSVERAGAGMAEKADETTHGIKEAAEGNGRHDTTERVLRPIKHAAHEVADKVRLAITMAKVVATTHKSTRLPRRAAKAGGHVTKRVIHPDVPGLKRK